MIKPTNGRLLVEVIEEKPKKGEEVKGDALMKATVKQGSVIFKNGSIVYFAPYGIEEIMVGKEKMLLVSEELIVAIDG